MSTTVRGETIEVKATTGGVAQADWRVSLPQLVGDGVTLREFRRSDAAVLRRIACSPEVAPFIWPAPPSDDAMQQFIDWSYSERRIGRYLCYGFVPAGQDQIVGMLELRPLHGFFRAELGFFLDAAFWGTGIFGTGFLLLCDFAFKVLGTHRIEARAAVNNSRSNTALRKLGARHEGVLKDAFVYKGSSVDQNLWVITNGSEDAPPAPVMPPAAK
jgi:ribosomal-protein-alanine N-acetyltransferase